MKRWNVLAWIDFLRFNARRLPNTFGAPGPSNTPGQAGGESREAAHGNCRVVNCAPRTPKKNQIFPREFLQTRPSTTNTSTPTSTTTRGVTIEAKRKERDAFRDGLGSRPRRKLGENGTHTLSTGAIDTGESSEKHRLAASTPRNVRNTDPGDAKGHQTCWRKGFQ